MTVREEGALHVSDFCPRGACCYAVATPLRVHDGATVEVTGAVAGGPHQGGPFGTQGPGGTRGGGAPCVVFGAGSTQLVAVDLGGRLELDRVTLSHGRGARGGAAHVSGVLSRVDVCGVRSS